MATETLIVGLIGIFTTFLTWILARPKQKADISGVISEAANVSIDTLLKVMEELRFAMEDIKGTNELLKSEIDKLIEENLHLQEQVQELKATNVQLVAENVKLRKEIHKINNNLTK